MPPFQETLLLFYISAMMVLGFYFIYSIFKRSKISSRILFFVISYLVYMSIASSVVSYVVFWKGNLIGGMAVLIISTAFIALPFRLDDEVVVWRNSAKYSIPVVSALVLYEISMGYLYASAFLPHSSNPFLLAINNIDFSIMMMIDGVFFFLLSEKRKDLSEIALVTFAFSMALMPNFFINFQDFAMLISLLSSAIVMVANIVMLYVIQMRRKSFNMQFLAIVLGGSDLMMMLGLSSFSINRSLYLISIAMVVSMAAYFFLVTHKLNRRTISANFSYGFILLVLVNAAELAMSFGVTSLGLSLSNTIFPKSTTIYAYYFSGMPLGMVHSIDFSNPLWWLFPFDPAKMGVMAFNMGLSVNLPFAYFWSSFMLIMTTTMSPFYAIMMGSEMSYLVLERYRSTKNRKVRNWAFAIIAGIPLFVIFIPFYTPYYVFGMSGMLFAVPLAILVVSILAIIITSSLFGRRVQCNMVCMAAHMWTNIYYDQFKPSKNHSVWNYLKWVFFALMVLSFSVFSLQQLGIMHSLQIGKITINPIDFYGMFVLNYIWWFFYFLTPIFGAYSCARQGWCGFGTLSGIFNKVFFKIRVHDIDACAACETKNCEASCPTSIPLNGDFLTKGYSNRISCIGCGDCVESCPQKNLGIVDVRDHLRRKTEKITD